MTTPFAPPVPPVTPTAARVRRNVRLFRALAPLARLGLRRWFDRVEVQGLAHLRQGPCLMLMNHGHVLDPLLLSAYAGRPIHFLITEPALFDSVPARMLAWTGQVPKRKLETDLRSIRLLSGWKDAGAAVCVFPEGRFSWDGRPLPLQPGLLHLVHHLGVPVVTVRQCNADRVWPVWATHARRTTVRLEVDPPRTFTAKEDVEAYVRARILRDPDEGPRWEARGKKLAGGLARLLRFCPDCGADGGLRDDLGEGNSLACTQCASTWAVGADNRLRQGPQTIDVGQALERVYAHVQRRWTRGVRLQSCADVEVYDAREASWKCVASGRLTLDEGGLEVGAWKFPLTELLGQTLDWGDVLLLRAARSRFALRMTGDSRAIWEWAVEQARGVSAPSTEIQRKSV